LLSLLSSVSFSNFALRSTTLGNTIRLIGEKPWSETTISVALPGNSRFSVSHTSATHASLALMSAYVSGVRGPLKCCV
jgi:hypothetical protein